MMLVPAVLPPTVLAPAALTRLPLALQQAAPRFFDLDPTAAPDLLGGWIVCFLTLAVFSFLYRDNPFYKLAEHVFVGLGTAYYTLEYYEQGVLQKLRDYLADAGGHLDAGTPVLLGGVEIAPELAIALRLVAVVFSVMLLMRLFAPNSWAPRWPLAIMVGVYAALKMTGETQSKLVLLVGNAVQPLTDPAALSLADAPRIELSAFWFTATRVVYYVGLFCALGHFLFTYRRSKGLAAISRVGIVTLMITFGSMFGFTVLGRIALLIERIADLQSYTAAGYSFAGSGLPPDARSASVVALSPPVLLAALMAVLLAIGALRRRGHGGEDAGPAAG